MVFTTNQGGFLNFGNKWLKDFFKLLEIEKGKLHWTHLANTTDNKALREEWEDAFSLQSALRTQVMLRVKNSADFLWHMVSILPVKNDAGELVSWTGFFADIHAQKLVEETLKNNEELKAMQKQLLNSQKKLEENLHELNKSNHDLEQFAYIASHDLQEPLRKIRNFTDLLEKNIENRPTIEKYIGRIDSASSRMQNLIKDVLNYSKLSKIESAFEPTDLNEIFKTIRVDMELLIEDKKANVEIGKLPVVAGIKQQLHQLFYNLISNALKFTSTDPLIRITASELTKEEIATHEELHTGLDYVCIAVKDNGIGFDEKYAKHIFTIFRRLNAREDYPGTGIGLALCKKIADNHHGIIEVASEVGKGSEFKVILPLE